MGIRKKKKKHKKKEEKKINEGERKDDFVNIERPNE